MTPPRLARLAAAAVGLTAVVAAVGASAAANTVPATRIGLTNIPLTMAQLTPPECAHMTLVNIVYGGTGTNANDLVLGTGAGETLGGGNGSDCIVGGGGNGSDVLIGGPGLWVVLHGGNGYDICYRNGSTFTWPISCEVYYP